MTGLAGNVVATPDLHRSRQHATTAIGVLSGLGTLFIAQELFRTWLDVRASMGSDAACCGVLDMSGAAWPASVLYFIGHFWVAATVLAMGRGTTMSPLARWVFATVVLLIGSVHVLRHTLLATWTIRPPVF